MPRVARIAPGGIIHHVLNRGVGRTKLFRRRLDYVAFQQCLADTVQAQGMRVLGFCVMPNHWHLLLWPEKEGDLARFMMRLTNKHVRRWLTAHDQVGSGHLYQGRYKSFAMQDDGHLANVARYIERNSLRAKLVERAELWPWSAVGQSLLEEKLRLPLAPWPIARRKDWIDWLNLPQTAAEEAAIQRSMRTGQPYGSDHWMQRTMKSLGWGPIKQGQPPIARRTNQTGTAAHCTRRCWRLDCLTCRELPALHPGNYSPRTQSN